MTLTEFLRARIADDEERARPAVERIDPGYFWAARTLAECDAKRKILEFAESHRSMLFGGHTSSVMDWPCQVLAVVYADHPDYDEAWRP